MNVTRDAYGGSAELLNATDGQLPLTGFDLWVLAIGALVLILIGFTLRRVGA